MLRRGAVVGQKSPSATEDELAAMMVGRNVQLKVTKDAAKPGAVVLDVENLIVADETGRVWRPGDILILVRKRSAAFEEVIRAMKALGVPVAGQDRLDIAAHIAVNDLVAVGRAGLLPAELLAVKVSAYTPPVSLAGVPLSVAVPSPLFTNVTPAGSASPPRASVGVG